MSKPGSLVQSDHKGGWGNNHQQKQNVSTMDPPASVLPRQLHKQQHEGIRGGYAPPLPSPPPLHPSAGGDRGRRRRVLPLAAGPPRRPRRQACRQLHQHQLRLRGAAPPRPDLSLREAALKDRHPAAGHRLHLPAEGDPAQRPGAGRLYRAEPEGRDQNPRQHALEHE